MAAVAMASGGKIGGGGGSISGVFALKRFPHDLAAFAFVTTETGAPLTVDRGTLTACELTMRARPG